MSLRSKWKARRARRSARAQYYGGSKDAVGELREGAQDAIDDSRSDYASAADDLREVGKTASRRESDAATDYRKASDSYSGTRSATENSIADISAAAQRSIAARNQAIASSPTMAQSANSLLQARTAQLASVPTIGAATDAAITGMGQAADARLTATTAANNRAAMGLAAGQGEGGALGMQQAIASGAQGGADALAANNIQQNDLGAQMRFSAAQTQNQQDFDSANLGLDVGMNAAGADRDALLARAQSDQAMTYDAANQVAGQNQALLGAAGARLGQADSRQQNFLAGRLGAASDMTGAAAGMVGQNLNNQQAINGTQLTADQANDKARLESTLANSLGGRLKSVFGGAASVYGTAMGGGR